MFETLKPSTTQKIIFDETGIKSVEQLIYADLRSKGWSEADAFYAAYRDNYSHLPKGQQRMIMKKLENDKGVQKRMNGETASGPDESKILPFEEIARETSKEKILSDLVMARKGSAEGSKEWSDLTKMIADIAKVKQDEIKTDEEQIKYFLPVHYPTSCKDCLIMLNNNKNGKKISRSDK